MLFKKNIYCFLFLILVFTSLSGNSNDGTPYITNIKYPYNLQNIVWSIEQTYDGTILIAGKKGLLGFDSENWTNIEIPDVAFALNTDESKSKIYVGGRNFAGYLTKNPEGFFDFKPLISDSLFEGNFTEIVETEKYIFFYSPHTILCFDKSSNKVKNTLSSGKNLYSGLFKSGSSVYLNVVNEGLYEIKETKLLPVNSEEIVNKSVVFCTDYSKEKTLIGTDNGDLYLFNGSTFTIFKIADEELLKTGILTDGIFIDSETLALSTMNFGVILIDKTTGKTKNTINSNSGLPGDFIIDLFTDNRNGLWMAHTLGLSRIETQLPISNFSSFNGLTSSIVTINYWNNKLYVATSNGVFALDSINRYTTKEILGRIPVQSSPVKRSTAIVKKEEELNTTNKEGQESDKKKKKGFLKKLFSKDESEASSKNKSFEKRSSDLNEQDKIEEQAQKYEYLKYNQYILKSKDYGFNQLLQINKRCKLLIPFEGQLLAVTDAKLYSIDKTNEVKEIFASPFIYSVIKSKYFSNNLLLVTENGIYQGVFNKSKWEFKLIIENNGHFNMTDLIELDGNNMLVAYSDDIVLYSLESDSTSVVNVFNPYSERATFKQVNDKKYLLIGNSVYIINFKNRKITVEKLQDIVLVNSFLSQQDNLWIRTENNNFSYFGNARVPDKIYSFLKAFENITDIQIDNSGNIWMVDDYKNIYRLNATEFDKYKSDVKVFIKEIRTNSGRYVSKQKAKLHYSENAIVISIVSPSYLKFKSTQYQYIIEGLMNDWSEWNTENIISVPFLPPGNYTLKVRAKNLFGEISETESFKFKVVPPFWRTPYFYAFCVILLLLGIQLWQKYKMRKHIQEKEILQQKVKERTIELELKNKAITDSIVYAERIQSGILPANDIISTSLKDYFILYLPKNIVSGDFYWLSQKENKTYIVAADCTGHGVPGAFMSMLGVAYLNEIIRVSAENITAAQILEELRERIIKLFSQETFVTNDGIDIALLIIDSSTRQIQYSGAYNPLYQVTSVTNNQIDKGNIATTKNGKVLVAYKADKFHVGKAVRNFRNYTNHVIIYNPGDTFYIFSDGFVDQFGGEEHSKFMYGPFRELILDITNEPMAQQKEALIKRLNEWKDEEEQTDDILIWGLKPL